jgi:lipoprotein-anchoring transpeptidase ErfK/SrfK
MLRPLVLALASLALLPSVSARAEVAKADPVVIQSSTQLSPPLAADDGVPHIAVSAKAGQARVVAAEEQGDGNDNDNGAAEPDKSQEAAKPAAPVAPTLTAQINLATQTMVVAEDGDVKYSWPISSGTEEFPTPRGTFHPQWVAKMWYSKKYDNAPMPNAVFINGGVAVHATQHVRYLGQPASHGCIRLAPGNAKIFYNLVGAHGLKMTRVSIFGTPKWRAPAVAAKEQPRRLYVEREDNDSWFGPKKTYRPVSAYDPGFAQRHYRQVPRNSYYNDSPRRVYYRRYDDERDVYVQRPQRRYYYYNNSGYGYGGGW